MAPRRRSSWDPLVTVSIALLWTLKVLSKFKAPAVLSSSARIFNHKLSIFSKKTFSISASTPLSLQLKLQDLATQYTITIRTYFISGMSFTLSALTSGVASTQQTRFLRPLRAIL